MPARTFAPDDECRAVVEEVVYKHACQHARLGPYEAVDAVANRSVSAPSVSVSQKVQLVTIPTEEISYVRYVPSRSGQHAIFAGSDGVPVPLRLFRDGLEVPSVPIERPPRDVDCGAMATVTGVVLEAGTEYLIELGPTREPGIELFFEHVTTFGEGWLDPCDR
jgi:hypothetical protein